MIEAVKGEFTSKWSPSCTHLTVKELIVSVKVLCAITYGQPIVLIQYWQDLLKCIKKNIKLPDVENYLPPISESLLNKDVSLKYKPERKTLFEGKIFVFPDENLKKQMASIVKIAGESVYISF